MSPKGHNTDLSRLLDGELQDMHEVEQINSAIKADPELMAEFEEQRGIKSLLGELDEYEAPDFMATRVMGEISSRRRSTKRIGGFKQILAAFGGVAVVALLAMSMLKGPQATLNNAMNASTMAEADASSPGTEYAATPWTDPDFESTIEDERLRDLLKFASDAHRNSELVHSADSATPNIDDLILMVGAEGGSH